MIDEMEVTSKKITSAVFQDSFMRKEPCNSNIYRQVKQRVQKEALALLGQRKTYTDIVLTLKTRLQAIFQSERILYEAVKTQPAQGSLKIHYSDTDDEEEDKEENTEEQNITNKLKKNKEEKKEESQKQYYQYLCEYKSDLDVYSRVQGLEMRGKKFRISNDGSCPNCSHKLNVFVILDFLFPAGDMPELLQYLINQGNAVLWSSKDNLNCKDPPTFLCNGRCPSDVLKCGFNINWSTTDLDKIYLFPERNYTETPKSKPDINVTKSQPEVEETRVDTSSELYLEDEEFLDAGNEEEDFSDEEYDEGLVDIVHYRNKVSWVVLDEVVDENELMPVQEEGIIRTMLALEEARTDYIYGEMKTRSNRAEPPAVVVHISDDKPEIIEITETNETISDKIGENDTVVASYVRPRNITNAGSAAYDIMSRNQRYSSHVPKQPQTQPQATASATPIHILKGATYYGGTQEKKETKPAFTAADFPVSKTGACPYCHSANVVYIILQEDDSEEELPELLTKLLKDENAIKLKKGEYDLPSFQCRGCTYGFNLDWSVTDLEEIFCPKPKDIPLDNVAASATSSEATTAAPAKTVAVATSVEVEVKATLPTATRAISPLMSVSSSQPAVTSTSYNQTESYTSYDQYYGQGYYPDMYGFYPPPFGVHPAYGPHPMIGGYMAPMGMPPPPFGAYGGYYPPPFSGVHYNPSYMNRKWPEETIYSAADKQRPTSRFQFPGGILPEPDAGESRNTTVSPPGVKLQLDTQQSSRDELTKKSEYSKSDIAVVPKPEELSIKTDVVVVPDDDDMEVDTVEVDSDVPTVVYVADDVKESNDIDSSSNIQKNDKSTDIHSEKVESETNSHDKKQFVSKEKIDVESSNETLAEEKVHSNEVDDRTATDTNESVNANACSKRQGNFGDSQEPPTKIMSHEDIVQNERLSDDAMQITRHMHVETVEGNDNAMGITRDTHVETVKESDITKDDATVSSEITVQPVVDNTSSDVWAPPDDMSSGVRTSQEDKQNEPGKDHSDSKLRNEWLNDDPIEADSPFTDSLVNIVTNIKHNAVIDNNQDFGSSIKGDLTELHLDTTDLLNSKSDLLTPNLVLFSPSSEGNTSDLSEALEMNNTAEIDETPEKPVVKRGARGKARRGKRGRGRGRKKTM